VRNPNHLCARSRASPSSLQPSSLSLLIPSPTIITFTDCIRFLQSLSARRAVLAAENLFLRKQLAFYQGHQIRPRRLTAAARFSLLFWSRFCDWRNALVIVKPETLIGWHRKGYKLFLRWKSRPGRPGEFPGWIFNIYARCFGSHLKPVRKELDALGLRRTSVRQVQRDSFVTHRSI
jgi:hypothetical protein